MKAQAAIKLIQGHEDWLMRRILEYAKRQGYAEYTSTLEEAWRLSIQQLSRVRCIQLPDRYPQPKGKRCWQAT